MADPSIAQVRDNGNNTKIVTVPAKSSIVVGDKVVIIKVEEYYLLRSGRRD